MDMHVLPSPPTVVLPPAGHSRCSGVVITRNRNDKKTIFAVIKVIATSTTAAYLPTWPFVLSSLPLLICKEKRILAFLFVSLEIRGGEEVSSVFNGRCMINHFFGYTCLEPFEK